VLVVRHAAHPEYEFKALDAIAAEQKRTPVVVRAGSRVVFGKREGDRVGLTVARCGNLDLDLFHGARSYPSTGMKGFTAFLRIRPNCDSTLRVACR
jgi:hypothetical protein